MSGTCVTVNAAVFATAVGIDARGEADVRAVVARDDCLGQVPVELRWQPGPSSCRPARPDRVPHAKPQTICGFPEAPRPRFG
jgi:hypothetical protein